MLNWKKRPKIDKKWWFWCFGGS